VTELNIGFGGVTDTAYRTLSTLVKEHAASTIQNTIFTQSNLLRSGALQQKKADKAEITVHAMVPGSSSTTWIRDWALLPKGVAPAPNKGRAQPSQIINVLRLGREAAGVELSDAEVLDNWEHDIALHSADVAQTLCRGIYGGSIVPQSATPTWTSTAANATVSIPFLDVSLFIQGKAYDFIDASSAKAYVVRCTDVVRGAIGANTANVAGTVSFINDVVQPATGAVAVLTDTAIALGDVFAQRGTTLGDGSAASSTTIPGNPITSFDDIAGAGASTALYGLDPATLPGWRGSNLSLGAPLTQEGVLGFAASLRQRSGQAANVAVMGSQALQAFLVNTGAVGVAYGNASFGAQNAVVRNVDSTMDKYGTPEENGMTPYKLAGASIVVDDNCPSTRIILFNRESVALYYWRKMAPENEAGEPLFVDRDTNTYSSQIRGSYQLVATNRQSVGVVSGITNL
jgi:hypothetical protein